MKIAFVILHMLANVSKILVYEIFSYWKIRIKSSKRKKEKKEKKEQEQER
jgi:hypothetical protein